MKAERRTAVGRNQVAQLRKQGWMPAVVYGDGGENISIAISEWELDQHVKAHHKVFALDIEGAEQSAFLQEVAWHTLTDRPLHADFKRIDLSQPIESELEVTLIGHPVGLGKGGALVKDNHVIHIRCLPTAMPEELEHDISKLEVEDRLVASQLNLPEGVELLSDPGMPLCHVARAVVVESAAAGEEG
ncbi:MAG: 50S ribosomal protein L25, partial [Planctomycetes bacterium]|nr:50S ribosomal protein L25 [Planctomycetota bacterium]